MKNLTVAILTHNRPDLIEETIRSVLNQTFLDFELIVSDNSTNDLTYELLKSTKLINFLKYIKRDSACANEHFDLLFSEIKTKYLIVFHDDDLMLSNMVETLYKRCSQENYAAIAGNAYLMVNNKATNNLFDLLDKDQVIKDNKTLIECYCKGNVNPFPAHIYNMDMIRECRYSEKANKYSDVVWLMDIVEKGNILWLKEPLMYYRVFSGQDSSTIDIDGYKKLTDFWKTKVKGKKNHFKINLFYKIKHYEYDKQNQNYNLSYYLLHSPFVFFPKMLFRKMMRMYD
jgi:glycosyltransferase involved in cell wall biosynthesis